MLAVPLSGGIGALQFFFVSQNYNLLVVFCGIVPVLLFYTINCFAGDLARQNEIVDARIRHFCRAHSDDCVKLTYKVEIKNQDGTIHRKLKMAHHLGAAPAEVTAATAPVGGSDYGVRR